MTCWINKKLTGNRRHRVGLFGKLILQVQEEAVFQNDRPTTPYGDTSHPMDGMRVTRWRDAKTEDLTMEETTELRAKPIIANALGIGKGCCADDPTPNRGH